MYNEPPRLAERLLRRLLPGREGEAIAGDLRESYMERGGGRLWYWVQGWPVAVQPCWRRIAERKGR